LEECGRGLFDVISWYLDGQAEENQKQMVAPLAGIPAQFEMDPFSTHVDGRYRYTSILGYNVRQPKMVFLC
jgi:hypothetical protein